MLTLKAAPARQLQLPRQAQAQTSPRPVCYQSMQLLRGTKEILIDHHGQVYRLKLTRNDKLILHK